MKRMSFVALVALVLCAVASQAYAGIETRKFGTQYVLTAKTGNFDMGKNYNVFSKYCIFNYNGGSQHWLYLGLNKGYVSVIGGFAANWRKQDIGFFGVKLDFPVGKFSSSTEFDRLSYDKDLYLWSGIDYNTTLHGHKVSFGPHIEMTKTDIARLQAGIHADIERIEIGVYLGEHSSAIRACYSFVVPKL